MMLWWGARYISSPNEAQHQVDIQAYHQVDLLLCLPENFDFRLFSGAYGFTSIILGHAVKATSGKLFLQEEKLILRHAAIDEVPHIVHILTSDV